MPDAIEATRAADILALSSRCLSCLRLRGSQYENRKCSEYVEFRTASEWLIQIELPRKSPLWELDSLGAATGKATAKVIKADHHQLDFSRTDP